MQNKNLYRLLSSGFPKDSTAPAMILPDNRVWTYGDIERASGRMANLIVSLGLKPGDRVAVQVEKTPEALVLYLATLRAGMVFLPLNPAYQRHELAYFLRDATPGLCVCRPQMRTLADELAARAGVAHVLELDDDGHGSLIDAAAPPPKTPLSGLANYTGDPIRVNARPTPLWTRAHVSWRPRASR